MPSAPEYPDDEIDDQADGLAFFNDAAEDDDDGDEPRSRRPVLELDEPHALPVVLNEVDDVDEDVARVVDLDAAVASSGALDLSALIGQFEAAQSRNRPTAPARPRESEAPKPTAPATSGPVFDLTSSSDEPVQRQEDGLEIARLRELVETERNNVRRGMADLVNFRRKAERDRERAIHDTLGRVIKQFLPIFDDFERSLLATAESRSFDQLSEGVQAILRNFEALLGKHGIHAVESLGRPFDPDVHEAVGTDDTSDQPEDTVVEELRRGYLIDGRLLRAALVKVSRNAVEELDEPEAALTSAPDARIDVEEADDEIASSEISTEDG